MKFEKEISAVLKSRRMDTDMLNVMEALGFEQDKFQTAFDVALEMDNNNLAKLLYTNFVTNKIVIEFLLPGKK